MARLGFIGPWRRCYLAAQNAFKIKTKKIVVKHVLAERMQACGLGWIGAGQMASAMAKGVVEAKIFAKGDVIASDKSTAQLESFSGLVGCLVTTSNVEIVQKCPIVVLSTKPAVVPIVLREIYEEVKAKNPLVISIAAGVSIDTMEALLPKSTRVVRVMPNTPCLVGETASAYAMGANATANDAEVVEKLFGSCGQTFKLKESLMDAVTGLSGSGPAYVYMMIEAMADGGVRMGLPRAVALKLAAQTVFGSAKMVLSTGEHPGLLKDKVASPGGTTIAGIHALEQSGFRGIIMNAVQAASERSKELSEVKKSKM